ncbi:IS110 family transposase [Spirillospora sp. CA-108201]
MSAHQEAVRKTRGPSVSKAGYRQLQRFARAWPWARWAIEGARGLGAPPADDGIAVLDVPAKLARRVRLLSTGHGRKTDEADALSVGIAAQTATGLHVARLDEAVTAMRALIEHRENLVRTRTQTINRLHALPTNLVPAGLPRRLTADIAAKALRGVRRQAVLGCTLPAMVVDLVAEIRRLDRRITAVAEQISAAVTDSGTSLTELHGRSLVGGQDPRTHSGRRPVPIGRRVRLLSRRRAAGRLVRRRQTAPAIEGRRPVAQLRTAHHGHHPDPPPDRWPGLLPAQTRRGQEVLRSLKRRLRDVVYRTVIRDTDTSLLAAA